MFGICVDEGGIYRHVMFICRWHRHVEWGEMNQRTALAREQIAETRILETDIDANFAAIGQTSTFWTTASNKNEDMLELSLPDELIWNELKEVRHE